METDKDRRLQEGHSTSLIQKICLVAASVTVSGLILEGTCRLLQLGTPTLYQADASRGWTLRPSVVTRWRVEGGADVMTNRYGFRDGDWDTKKDPKTLRIAIFGDSFTEALQVNAEERWGNLLRDEIFAISGCKALKGGKNSIEVMNFGVGGYGTGQSWLNWKVSGREFSPDIVLHAAYFGNDLRENIGNRSGSGSGPSFYLKPGGIGIDDSFRNSRGYRLRKSALGELARLLTRHSHLLQFLNTVKNASSQQAGKECDLSGCKYFPLGGDGTRLYGKESDQIKEQWELFSGILRKWNDEVKDEGGRLVVTSATTPAQLWPNAKEKEKVREIHALDWLKPEKTASQILAQQDIPYIPLAPEMQRLSRAGITAHGFSGQRPGSGYGHWNAEGHKAAAKVLARGLCTLSN